MIFSEKKIVKTFITYKIEMNTKVMRKQNKVKYSNNKTQPPPKYIFFEKYRK